MKEIERKKVIFELELFEWALVAERSKKKSRK